MLVTASGGSRGIAGGAMGADVTAECSSKKSMACGLPFSMTEKSDLGRSWTGSPFFLSTTTSTRTWRATVRKRGTLADSAEGAELAGMAEVAGGESGGTDAAAGNGATGVGLDCKDSGTFAANWGGGAVGAARAAAGGAEGGGSEGGGPGGGRSISAAPVR